jgi:RNA polymerase sigma-70 factor (ECF subfamily)
MFSRTETNSSDLSLLASLRGGDSASFHEMYRRHAPAVLRYAWRLVSDSYEAEELVQETFITFWAKRRSIDVPGASVLPWLLVTCRNHGANAQRRRTRNQADEIDADVISSNSDQSPSDTLHWVLKAIEAMNPVDQQMCRMCLIEGVPYREAATQLGTTTGTVAKRIERIRKHLRAVRAAN